MKTKNKILVMACLMLTLNLFSQGDEKKNIVGIGGGFCPEKVVWIGDPINLWADINLSPIFNAFYARQVSEILRLGGYFEYENATFTGTSNKASRLSLGLNWLARYPNKPIHLQLGGYFGYGSVKADMWDHRLGGIEYGLLVGPAYEKNNFGIALHFPAGFSYYTSSGTPDEVSYSKGTYLLKAYYKF
ncbi:MAG: hypothetical protein IPJ37_16585 [Bacteroidales bacterium]|nr:hypothetical protein [Bacteroidales bacterium]